jgi:predicted DCC family thiol-disulfide oxidoreductase YuxK
VEKTFDIGDRLLVIFDGHCGLCSGSVRWLLRRDQRDRLRFVASESEKVAAMLAQHGGGGAGRALAAGRTPDPIPETILVVRDAGAATESVLERSDAVVALLRELPRPWPWVGVALGWVPKPIRDLGYRLVARWRYRIWGRLESCPVPTAEERERFL